ncbi:hypothetical protein MBLNU457_3565t1 [Dothideomycetes sp. NU457]
MASGFFIAVAQKSFDPSLEMLTHLIDDEAKQIQLFAAVAEVAVAGVGGPHRTREAEIGCRGRCMAEHDGRRRRRAVGRRARERREEGRRRRGGGFEGRGQSRRREVIKLDVEARAR